MPTLGVSVVILENDKVLLQKRADFRIWSLPGGRVEADETIEAAAIRETLEETGLEIRLVRKVGIYWKPQHDDTVTVFQAEVTGGQIIRQSEETLDVRWHDPAHFPRLIGTTRRYIDDTIAQHQSLLEVTQHISPLEVFVRRVARRLYMLAHRSL